MLRNLLVFLSFSLLLFYPISFINSNKYNEINKLRKTGSTINAIVIGVANESDDEDIVEIEYLFNLNNKKHVDKVQIILGFLDSPLNNKYLNEFHEGKSIKILYNVNNLTETFPVNNVLKQLFYLIFARIYIFIFLVLLFSVIFINIINKVYPIEIADN